MSFEQFKYIVDQFPRLAWIGMTGIGESFLNPDFMKMLRYIKSKSVTVELYDNFNFTTKDMIKELVDLGVERIYISLDAATKKTYEKIRVNGNFDRVIENVKTLFEYKRKKKSKYPNKIDFHYIVSKTNLNELTKFIELVDSFGSENSEILFTRVLHSFKEIEELFVEIPKNVISDAEKKAKELGIKIVWGGDVPLTKPSIKNCTAWMMPFIFVTGHVIPCCAGNEANEREFQKKYAMGNIFEKSFKEIWNGEKYRELRKMIREGKVPTVCKSCTIYELGGKK
jgi:radical SAM protein with 4Fe4S-binding SPASM domain